MKNANLTILKNSKVLIFIMLVIVSNVSANENDIKPFVKGSFKQIKQAHIDKPYIVTFWSETCAYCMKELTLFGKLLTKYPNIDIVSVTTDPFLNEEKVNKILASKNLKKVEKWVFANNYAERLYFDVDKSWRGELPYTLFFDKANKMIKHLGVIKEKELVDWFEEQHAAQ